MFLVDQVTISERKLLRRAVSGVLLVALLASMVMLTLKAGTIIVPDDFPTIQEAINHATEGETVFARSGIYYEHISLDRSVLLIGENRDNTIIDGSNIGTVVSLDQSHVTLCNFTIQNSGKGYLDSGIRGSSANNDVSDNIIANNAYGIILDGCSHYTLSRNSFQNNTFGLRITGPGGSNTLRENIFCDNYYSFGIIWPYELSNLINDIDASNKIDNNPIYYLVNQKDLVIEPDAFPNIGYLEIVNSTNISVKNIELTARNPISIDLWYVTDAMIENVTASDKGCFHLAWCSNVTVKDNKLTDCGSGGLAMHLSQNCSFLRNTVTNIGKTGSWNAPALFVQMSSDNMFMENTMANSENVSGITLEGGNNVLYHNNFINTGPVSLSSEGNTWDAGYPQGGNYWSSYSGYDLFSGSCQNETGSDGIGDISCSVGGESNIDHYPLMNPWVIPQIENASSNNKTYQVDLVSNATIQDFSFNETNDMMNFNLSGESGSHAYCRLVYSKQLMNNTLAVLVNGTACDYSITDNSTHFFLFFTYHLSYDEVLVLQTVLGDINGDRKVDVKDVYVVAKAYGSSMGGPDPPGHPWKPICDINKDGKVDAKDYYTVCKNYGKTYP